MRRFTLALLACAPLCLAATPAPHYAVSGHITGPDGGWDYARVDPASKRLYVARTDAVTVIDLATAKAMSWGMLARGHAVVPVAGNRLLVTSGNDDTVRFFDTATGKQLAILTVGKKPDAAITDAAHARAYVMNGDGGTVSVIDTAAMRVVRSIPVKPALEYAALGKDGTLFINDEDLNEIEVVNPAAGTVGAPIAMPGCEGPTGLAYDTQTDRLISACANGKAIVVDATARQVVATLETGKGADAVILDAPRRLAFIPCGKDGVLDILALDATGVTNAGRVTTEVGAKTGALDPATGTVYLPTAKLNPPAKPGDRPTPVPGTFHVLVVKRG